jgi:hypothetical protein
MTTVPCVKHVQTQQLKEWRNYVRLLCEKSEAELHESKARYSTKRHVHRRVHDLRRHVLVVDSSRLLVVGL